MSQKILEHWCLVWVFLRIDLWDNLWKVHSSFKIILWSCVSFEVYLELIISYSFTSLLDILVYLCNAPFFWHSLMLIRWSEGSVQCSFIFSSLFNWGTLLLINNFLFSYRWCDNMIWFSSYQNQFHALLVWAFNKKFKVLSFCYNIKDLIESTKY